MFEHPATLLALGVFIGFLGSLVGIGGGFLMVPYFTLALGWLPPAAVGTSLSVIAANASSGAIGFARQKRVDFLVGIVLGLATIPATVLGHWANLQAEKGFFKVAFAAMVAIAALLIVFFRAENRPGLAWFRRGVQRRLVTRGGETYEYGLNLWSAAAISLLLGFVASFFGVGGGFIHVPLLILLYGVPPHVAMATSHFVLVLTTGAAALQFAWSGDVKGIVFLWMGLGAIAGAQLGVRLSARLPGRLLRRILAGVLLVLAAAMVWQGLRQRA